MPPVGSQGQRLDAGDGGKLEIAVEMREQRAARARVPISAGEPSRPASTCTSSRSVMPLKYFSAVAATCAAVEK